MLNNQQRSGKRQLPVVNQFDEQTQLLLNQSTIFPNNALCHSVSAPVPSKQANDSFENSFHEVTIPVPWGHISGKWWGNKNVTPLIGLHGFEDNAGTFDRIAPFLNVPAFLAFDAPGHGKSSNFPEGMTYSFLDFVYSFRLVVLHFGWKKVSILGHSYGGAIGLVYAALYPKEVNCLMRVDCGSVLIFLETKGLSRLKTVFEDNIKFERRHMKILNNPPAYTWEELLTAYCKGLEGSVSREHAHHVLKRGSSKHPILEERFFFSRDPKLKYRDFSCPGMSLLEECNHNVKCHVLSIFGTEGYLKKFSVKYTDIFDLYLNQDRALEKSAASYERYDVPGTHHLHLNDPQSVAIIVNRFLSQKEKSSL